MHSKLSDTYKIPELNAQRLKKDASSLIYAYFFCLAWVILFVILNPEQMVHWFILPVTLCGVVIGIDAINWARGRMDVMDPVGWVGIFGFHFFFISPFLILLWNHQMAFLPPLDDWRPWLGGVGLINLIGLILYRISRNWITRKLNSDRRTIRILQPKLINLVLYFALIITAALQMWILFRVGGIVGYINQYETIGFSGYGVIFTFSESFPFLLMIGLAIFARGSENRRTWFVIFGYLFIFFILRLVIFGGLRGSRSNTIYAMIWALGVVHLWIRPLSRRILIGAFVAGIIFLYLMGFYKSLGSDFLRVLQNPTQIQQVEQKTNRTVQLALISDLSRSDVQAYMLYNLVELYPDFDYVWGRTYLAGYLAFVPRSIWANKPPFIEQEGTNALLGPDTYIPGLRVSSRVYGLMGEAILNFGIYLAPLMFISLGLIVGFTRRWYYNLHPNDVFRLWIPFLIIFSVTYITSNSDNNAIFFVLRTLSPAIVLWLGSAPHVIDAGNLE